MIKKDSIVSFSSFKNIDSDLINKLVSKNSYCVIKNFIRKSLCDKIVHVFQNKLNTSEDNPTIGENPDDIKKIYQKLSIGGYMNGWDYRPRYVRIIYTPFFDDDKYGVHNIGKKFCKLRNLIQGYPEDFAIDSIQENLWTALRLQHYPEGGGFFSKHKDVVLEKTTLESGLKQFNQFLLLLTTKGEHFSRGGAYVYDQKKKINLEDVASGGDVIIYNGTNEHGVDDIDPHKTANTNTSSGRLVLINSLYKNMLTNENVTKKELNEINQIVVEQICKLFDVGSQTDYSVNNIKDWDSINHINLMIMIEDAFEINLDYAEFKNCICNTNISKLVSKTINE